jgi:hypothetical protein
MGFFLKHGKLNIILNQPCPNFTFGVFFTCGFEVLKFNILG